MKESSYVTLAVFCKDKNTTVNEQNKYMFG